MKEIIIKLGILIAIGVIDIFVYKWFGYEIAVLVMLFPLQCIFLYREACNKIEENKNKNKNLGHG